MKQNWHLIFSGAAIEARLARHRVGSSELRFGVLCAGGALSWYYRWPTAKLTGPELFFIALGGGAAILAASDVTQTSRAVGS